jgi:PRC-barrel domain
MFGIPQRSMHGLRPRTIGAATVVALATLADVALAQAPAAALTEEANGSPALNGAGVERFPPDQMFRILGKDVLSATGESMGRIVDVLFERSGKACAAVIDFGGFLGVGTRKIAIDWSALRFDLGETKNVIALDLGREQLRAAPEYKESDKPIAVLTLPQFGPSRP